VRGAISDGRPYRDSQSFRDFEISCATLVNAETAFAGEKGQYLGAQGFSPAGPIGCWLAQTGFATAISG
jgi:hypothetical protein